jgi:hypothetical protein
LLFLGFGIAAALGPVLGSRVYVSTGTYQYAFFAAGGLACAALVILSIVRTPQPAAVEPTSVMVVGS